MTKETSHFSSIGDVFMPYSMQFFGNFYIHGWPYYADGSAVRPGFSGGCVRLSTADAKKVFAFADTGVPLFVYTEPVLPPVSAVDGFPVRIRNVTLPKVSARAFIVADVRTGDVYGERAADGVFPIASITKVMTAIVANDSISFDRLISVASTSDQGEGDYGSIGKGGTFSIRDLLYPLLLESNNAVAHSIAASYGNRLFIQAMNAKAQALGAHHTMFTDASGISADNRSTATDLFRIAQYVMQNRSFILETTRLPEKKVTARSGKTYLFRNFNHFFADAAFVGGKTGHTTAAKDTMLSLFNEQVGGATTTIAVVVLGSDDRVADTKLLRSWFEQAAVRAAAVESQPVSVSGTGRSVEL
jgi:D-alanyl-D-alanine carboxypeptidase